jgi:hypothetical protein
MVNHGQRESKTSNRLLKLWGRRSTPGRITDEAFVRTKEQREFTAAPRTRQAGFDSLNGVVKGCRCAATLLHSNIQGNLPDGFGHTDSLEVL